VARREEKPSLRSGTPSATGDGASATGDGATSAIAPQPTAGGDHH